MKETIRTAVAYIAGLLITGYTTTLIYDISRGKIVSFSGSLSIGKINIYDNDRESFITSSDESMPINLFDYESGAFISLIIDNNNFSGYDSGSESFYNGFVIDKNISFFDFESGQFSYYLLM